MVAQSHAKNHKNPIRQDSKNGLSSHYVGYEIDPYCCNGDTPESDSVAFGNSGGGEDGIIDCIYLSNQPNLKQRQDRYLSGNM